MNQSKIFYGTNFWEDGRTSVDDDERPGRKSTSATPENVAKFRKAILADRRQTIHDVCEIVGLSYGNVQRILADNLNIRNISARFLPRLLSDVHTAHHVSVCRELKQQARDDPNFIFNIITGDEAWVYCCESETLQQLSQWKQSNSPRPKKARQVCSSVKFSDIQGTVHKEFLPPGQTVNGKFYCEVLKRLREGIRRRRPDKWKNNDWFLHHDNAPAHTSLVVRQFPDFQKRYRDSPPPYSPDLAPATFSYSPRWNNGWNGVVLTIPRRSTQNRKRLSTLSHLRTSRDAWNHGKHAGIAVYMPKGTTSKETVETRNYGKKLFLW